MQNFETLGKTEEGKWAIKIFDEPFNGEILVINSLEFNEETGDVAIDYSCDFKDESAIHTWLQGFITEAMEFAIAQAEALVSAQDKKTDQNP